MKVSDQLQQLVQRTGANCAARGEGIVGGSETASRLVMLWLSHLEATKLTGTADCLIEGARSAIRESTACIALGLVRPALNSLRLQIDLTLGWLYFKDHSVEWDRVQNSGEGYKLKTELMKYAAESFDGFGARFGILKDCKSRSQEDPYRLLSAHVHGQSQVVLPKIQLIADVVASEPAQDEALKLQAECSEFINDVFWAVFAKGWTGVPDDLRNALQARFKTSEQRVAFFT